MNRWIFHQFPRIATFALLVATVPATTAGAAQLLPSLVPPQVPPPASSAVAVPLAGPLTLSAALAEASRNAFAVKMAVAESDARRAEVRLPNRGLLPSAHVEAGVMRTSDPLGAFGTLLKQRAVTAADFDPAALNNPAAISNVQGGVVVDVPVFNLDAWMGRRAAVANADAGKAQSEWTIAQTQQSVVQAYFGAILANEQITAMTAARKATDAFVQQADAMLRQGLVTKADGLQASVRSGEVSIQLLEARHNASTATRQLQLVLGRTGEAPTRTAMNSASAGVSDVSTATPLTLPTSLPSDSVLLAFANREVVPTSATTDSAIWSARMHEAFMARGDLSVAKANVSAARFDVARNNSALLPKINGFARLDWNTPRTVFGGKNNWTIGVMASWSVFSGGSNVASIRAASARLRAAEQAERATRAQASVEIATARQAVEVALLRLQTAALQEEQSTEARRLVALRYGGGLATIAELLAADATATQTTLAHSNARYTLIVALAAFRHATAADLMTLTALDSPLPSAR